MIARDFVIDLKIEPSTRDFFFVELIRSQKSEVTSQKVEARTGKPEDEDKERP